MFYGPNQDSFGSEEWLLLIMTAQRRQGLNSESPRLTSLWGYFMGHRFPGPLFCFLLYRCFCNLLNHCSELTAMRAWLSEKAKWARKLDFNKCAKQLNRSEGSIMGPPRKQQWILSQKAGDGCREG